MPTIPNQSVINARIKSDILPHMIGNVKPPKLHEGEFWLHTEVTDDALVSASEIMAECTNTGVHGQLKWKGELWLLKASSVDDHGQATLSWMKEVFVDTSEFEAVDDTDF